MMDAQAIFEAMDGVVMLIDGDLRIVRIGRTNWNEFRIGNGGTALDPENAQGSTVTRYFSAGIVRDTYQQLFKKVLGGVRGHVAIEYRCDSPDTRRQMRLSVTPVREAGTITHILYQSTLLSENMRPPLFLFSAPSVNSVSEISDAFEKTIGICSICSKVKQPNATSHEDEWIEAQEYYHHGGSDDVVLSHGFCPPCYDRLMAEIPRGAA
ncbi:MAG: hypothetical protein WEB93_00340 [Sphingomonadales bacterium]